MHQTESYNLLCTQLMPAAKPESKRTGGATKFASPPEIHQSTDGDKGKDSPSNTRRLSTPIGLGFAVIVVIAVVVGVAAYGGYSVGVDERHAAAATVTAEEWHDQYTLAVEDIEASEYMRAAQRLEYIHSGCPDCAGVADKLSQVRDALGTPVATRDVTPTSQALREIITPEELFADLVGAYQAQDWESVVMRSTALRMKQPEFEGVQVGGMLFVGLQNRGIQQIETGVIELGIADLEQASQIGPLDAEARQYRRWAFLYLSGMAFWELNWPIVIDNLSLLYQTGPNFRDVEARLNEAYVAWGNVLRSTGESCDAQMKYADALSMAPSADVTEKMIEAEQACSEAGQNPKQTPDA